MATLKPTTVPAKRLAETISGASATFKVNNIRSWSATATDLASADFGSRLWAVFRNSAGTLMEIMEVDPATITSASSPITILLRGLKFDGDDATEVAANKLTWVKGDTIVELGTHVPQLLYQYVDRVADQTVAGIKTFSSIPATTGGNPVAANDLARKAYVDSVVAGIATSVSEVVPGTAGETLADGNLVYLKLADNRWWKTDADTAATVDNVLLGIAQGAGTAGVAITNGVMLRGVDDAQTGLTAGEVQYASNTAGGISNTPGTTEVTVGVAKSTTELYFDPRFNQQITEDQQDALAGTSGTPSSSNKYVTDADTTATPTANKVVRYSADGSLPVYKVETTAICAETLAVGNIVASYFYQSDGGVTLDAKAVTSSNSTTSLSTTITVASQSNRTAVVVILHATGSGYTSTGVTFDGVAMTQLVNNQLTTAQHYISIYRLISPNVGAARTVTNTFSGTVSEATMFIYDYYNTDIATPGTSYSAAAGASGISSTAPVNGSLLLSLYAGGTALSGNDLSNTQSAAPGGTNHLIGDSGIIPNTTAVVTACTGAVSAYGFIYVKPYTAPVFGYAKKTSASSTTNAIQANLYDNFLGVVTAVAGGGVLGQVATIQTDGVVTGLSGLTPLATQYLSDTASTLSATAGTNSKKVGRALSATTLLIKHDN